MNRKTNHRGTSLLEILVVLGLMTALLVVTIPAFFKLLQAYRLQTAAHIISTNLRFARSAALKQKVLYRLTFRDSSEVNPNTYTIEYAPSGAWQLVNNMDTDIPDRVEIDTTSIDQVQFDSRGVANVSGFVLLTSADGRSFKITISSTGAVNVTQ